MDFSDSLVENLEEAFIPKKYSSSEISDARALLASGQVKKRDLLTGKETIFKPKTSYDYRSRTYDTDYDLNESERLVLDIETFHKAYDDFIEAEHLENIFKDDGTLLHKGTYGSIVNIQDSTTKKVFQTFWARQFKEPFYTEEQLVAEKAHVDAVEASRLKKKAEQEERERKEKERLANLKARADDFVKTISMRDLDRDIVDKISDALKINALNDLKIEAKNLNELTRMWMNPDPDDVLIYISGNAILSTYYNGAVCPLDKQKVIEKLNNDLEIILKKLQNYAVVKEFKDDPDVKDLVDSFGNFSKILVRAGSEYIEVNMISVVECYELDSKYYEDEFAMKTRAINIKHCANILGSHGNYVPLPTSGAVIATVGYAFDNSSEFTVKHGTIYSFNGNLSSRVYKQFGINMEFNTTGKGFIDDWEALDEEEARKYSNAYFGPNIDCWELRYYENETSFN